MGLISKSPSNNSAEVTAAIEACLCAKSKGQKELTIVTDSKYLHSAATLYIDKWQTNNWIDNKRKLVVNQELFEKLIDAKEGLQIEWIHVRGHAITPGNIRADMLAKSLLDKNIHTLNVLAINKHELQNEDKKSEITFQKSLKRKIDNLAKENHTIFY